MSRKKKTFPLRLKSLVMIVTMTVVMSACAGIISMITFSDTNETLFRMQSRDLAYTAAFAIDGDALKAVSDAVMDIYRSVPDDKLVTSDEWGSRKFSTYLGEYSEIAKMPEFKTVYDVLLGIQHSGISALSSIYTITYDESRGTPLAIYLVDAADEDPCPPGTIDRFTAGENTDIASHPENGIAPYVIDDGPYGILVVSGAPVFDKSGNFAGMVAVDLSMNEITGRERMFLIYLLIVLASVGAVTAVISIFTVSRAVIHPLNRLANVASSYILDSEHAMSFDSLEIHRNDEIGALTDAMKKMEHDLREYIRDITVMTAEKERVTTELNVAAKMQSDMLPTVFPDRKDIDIYAMMTPAKIMGGDFYDFFMIDDDHIGLVMADVSGKGFPAAMFMIVSRALLKTRATASGSPSDILNDVNNLLCADNPSEMFVTAWFGILTLSTGDLIYANAGHEYIALKRAGGNYALVEDENMPPLASMEDLDYFNRNIQLKNGDKLFLYTDGVPEAKAPDGSRLGTDRMIDILNREKDSDPETLLKTMQCEIDRFSGSNDPFDDVTMMSVVWNGK